MYAIYFICPKLQFEQFTSHYYNIVIADCKETINTTMQGKVGAKFFVLSANSKGQKMTDYSHSGFGENPEALLAKGNLKIAY